jgi:hypothetical protein
MSTMRMSPRGSRRFRGSRFVAIFAVSAVASSAALLGSITSEVAAAATAPWPMYGHDAAHTGATPAWAPTSEPVPVWSVELDGGVQDNAAPVVGADGTIYAPTDLALYAIRPNGTVAWKSWGADAFDRTDIATAPAIGPDGTVYVWRAAAPDDDHFPGGALYALDPTTGDISWEYVTGRVSYGSPTVGPDGTVYVGSAEDTSRLYAIRPDDSLRWAWTSSEPGTWIESSPAVTSAGEVYFHHNSEGLVALDANGHERWIAPGLGESWNSPTIGPDGTVYIGNSDYHFYAVRPDGTVKWQAPLPNWTSMASAAISADGTILRGDDGGVFHAITTAGSVRWSYDTSTGEDIASAPAVAANGVVFFPAGDAILALRVSDGGLLWRKTIGEYGQPPAIGADGTLYVLASTGTGSAVLHAFGCGTDADGDGHGDRCTDVTAPSAATVRLAGSDRFATAVAISQASFPTAGTAAAVVLARGDDPSGFADALSGTPLARAKNGPVLITSPAALLDVVRSELRRVLPEGGTVYLLGGEAALSADVEAGVIDLGYFPERIAGKNRYDTALAVAAELDAPDPLLVTTGDNFPDALAAGAAAVHTGGAVLLTPSNHRWPALDDYLASRAGAAVFAVGGPAARPYPGATALSGADRFATAVAVAERFFAAPTVAGVARADRFPDALAGGAHVGALGGPLLLTPTDTLAAATEAYLCGDADSLTQAVLFGGTGAISATIHDTIAERVAGTGCLG